MPMSQYTEYFVADEHLLALVRQVVAAIQQRAALRQEESNG